MNGGSLNEIAIHSLCLTIAYRGEEAIIMQTLPIPLYRIALTGGLTLHMLTTKYL